MTWKDAAMSLSQRLPREIEKNYKTCQNSQPVDFISNPEPPNAKQKS